jgi:2-polyprenyl-6-methoxyphenol hydroxylase-like FAD-dependent oxidoreductase
MALCTGLIDADALSDALELSIKERKSLGLLDFYSDERRNVSQTFVDSISSQNKLRWANYPEKAMED